MRRPQVTIRTLLVLILAFGVVLGFGMPALEILGTKDSDEHTYIGNAGGGTISRILAVTPAISRCWSRHWRE
ncbi:MAG: hypothetical protein ACLQVF_06220 [Isosphaeraceae bacterium]